MLCEGSFLAFLAATTRAGALLHRAGCVYRVSRGPTRAQAREADVCPGFKLGAQGDTLAVGRTAHQRVSKRL